MAMQSIDSVKAALISVTGLTVFHYAALKQTGAYCVWAESGSASTLGADNSINCEAIDGYIDYYTKTEADAKKGLIETALNDAKIAHKLDSVQYEPETKYIHYRWYFEVPNG